MDKKKEAINILLVSLDDRFAKNVVENLADILDMYNSDCKDLVVYDLIDPKDILEKCGIDYFKKREKAVLENCACYHDTIMSIDYDLFKEYHDLFKNSIVVFLNCKSSQNFKVPSKIDRVNRENFLRKHSTFEIYVERKVTRKVCNMIIDKLKEII